MISRRTLALCLGVVALLSVLSVLSPKDSPPQAPPPRQATPDMARLETLQRVAQTQQSEIRVLTSQTRELSEMLAARQTTTDRPGMVRPLQVAATLHGD